MDELPIVEQTSLTVVHATPGGAVLVEAPCGCQSRAARTLSVSPLPPPPLEPWARVQVSRVMPNGDLLVTDRQGRQYLLADVAVERPCPRHRREKPIPRWLIVVRRDRFDLCQSFRQSLEGNPEVEVILDRRTTQVPVEIERRRTPLTPREQDQWETLGFLVVSRGEEFTIDEGRRRSSGPADPTEGRQ